MSTIAGPARKYERIVHELRRAILNREYQAGERLPPDAQLADRFGASRLTVMRAMRDLQVEGLVERKAGSGTYVRSTVRPGHVFGLLIPDLGQTAIIEPICRGMARAGQSANQALLWGNSTPNADREQQAEELCRYFIDQRVAGVFFVPVELTPHKDEVNQHVVAMLERASMPVVLLDRCIYEYPKRSRHDLVGIDNRRAGDRMTDYLLGLGCRRIGFMARPFSAPTVEARVAGYREALWRHGIPFDAEWVHWGDPSDTIKVKEYLERARPEAVVCANDKTAGLLMHSLSALDIKVPGELRIVGIDDVNYARLLPVPLTTLQQPCEDIGAEAISAMMERLDNPDLRARDILLDCDIVVRRSCGGGPNVRDPVRNRRFARPARKSGID